MSIPISLMRGNFYIDCGGKVNNSTITDSNIYMKNDGSGILNMSGAKITNVALPTDPSDVANKNYVDTFLGGGGGGSIIPITLTGTNYSLITSSLSGVVTLTIKNSVSGGPSAIFNISKNEQLLIGNPTRISSSAGLNTYERLQIRWLANSGLELRKTGNNYDGIYNVILSIL
jgi:hypothetical protein